MPAKICHQTHHIATGATYLFIDDSLGEPVPFTRYEALGIIPSDDGVEIKYSSA